MSKFRINKYFYVVGAFAEFWKTICFIRSACPSVCPYVTTLLILDGLPLNLIIEYFSKVCRENWSFLKNLTRITNILHEDQNIFFIISRSILVRTIYVPDKSCRQNKTHLYSKICFRKSHYLWDNVKKYCRAGLATDDQGTCALHVGYQKLKNTLSLYVVLTAFPLQQWLHECA
jgi:hypothetical protein